MDGGSDIPTRLIAVPLDFDEACALVARWHRYHVPPVGHKFSIGAARGDAVCGAVIVGRPVSRMRDDGLTLEVTRLCVDPGLPHVVASDGRAHRNSACSFLYAAAARATFALGYRRIGTYILDTETGRSLVGAGWRLIGERGGGRWSRTERPRVDLHPTQGKLLFERVADA
jgi:hypothetical protein